MDVTLYCNTLYRKAATLKMAAKSVAELERYERIAPQLGWGVEVDGDALALLRGGI